MENNIDHITASALRDYLNCPKLYYYRHLLKIRLPDKPVQLVFGGAVHDAIEEFYNKGTLLDALQMFDQKFKREQIDNISDADYNDHLIEGARFLNAFVEAQGWLKEIHGIGFEGQSEEKFETHWMHPMNGKILPVKSTGRFDRITSDEQILEVKTANKAYSQKKIDTLIQPKFYPMSYLNMHGHLPKAFVFIVLIKGRKDPIQVIKVPITKEGLAEFFEKTELVIRSIKSGYFDKGSGFMHQYCDCQKYEEALNI